MENDCSIFFKTKIPLFIVASLLAGFWAEIDNKFAFARIISFYPFFLAGYYLSKEKVQKIIAFSTLKKIPVGIAALGAGAVIAFFSAKNLHLREADFLFKAYPGNVKAHLIGRLSIFAVASLCIIALSLLMVNHRIPIITKAGRNSLAIYLIHRPLTLALNRFVKSLSTRYLLAVAIVFTAFALVVLGSDFISKLTDRVLSFFTDAFLRSKDGSESRRRFGAIISLVLVFAMLAAPVTRISQGADNTSDKMENTSSVPTDEKQNQFENAFKLTFAGDLILLKGRVKNAYNVLDYNFSDVFEYAKRYISNVDYADGVFKVHVPETIKLCSLPAIAFTEKNYLSVSPSSGRLP